VYTLVGKVENVGTESVDNVRVITTFYNAAGTVVSLNYTDASLDDIKPGFSKTFTVTPVDYYSRNDIESYAILVQSSIQYNDSTPTNPSNTNTPTNSALAPTSTATTTADIELTKSTIICIIVLFFSIVSVFTILVLRTRKKHAKTIVPTE
jgi:hypothetical protein